MSIFEIKGPLNFQGLINPPPAYSKDSEEESFDILNVLLKNRVNHEPLLTILDHPFIVIDNDQTFGRTNYFETIPQDTNEMYNGQYKRKTSKYVSSYFLDNVSLTLLVNVVPKAIQSYNNLVFIRFYLDDDTDFIFEVYKSGGFDQYVKLLYTETIQIK